MQVKIWGLPLTFAALACGLMLAFPATAQGPSGASSSLPSVSTPTGGAVTQVFVSGGNRALFRSRSCRRSARRAWAAP